jgi:predicted metal-dependent enzyme (double-stranded beta helix superfamily)
MGNAMNAVVAGQTVIHQADLNEATLNQPATDAAGFPLLEDVIVLIDAAMRAREPRRIVDRLVDGLRGVLAVAGALPPELLRGDPSGIVRRELYRSPEHGYQIIAITWLPGQGSSVHDHGQTWGVEAVLRGRLDVLDYRVRGRHRALSELHPADQHPLVDGAVIGLLPPHDLHSCRNADARETAVSLHVYGQPLDSIKRYVHVEGDLYRPERIRLQSV